MTTHFQRVRTDFKKDHAQCLDRRSEGDCYFGEPDSNDPPPVHKPCKLPEECELCTKWVCNACEKTVPWTNGGGETIDDGGGMLCDECWCKFLEEWLNKQDKLEVKKMEHYKQSEAL